MAERKTLNPADVTIEKVAAPLASADFYVADSDPTDPVYGPYAVDDSSDDVF